MRGRTSRDGSDLDTSEAVPLVPSAVLEGTERGPPWREVDTPAVDVPSKRLSGACFSGPESNSRPAGRAVCPSGSSVPCETLAVCIVRMTRGCRNWSGCAGGFAGSGDASSGVTNLRRNTWGGCTWQPSSTRGSHDAFHSSTLSVLVL